MLDLKDRATVCQQRIQGTSTTTIIESVEDEHVTEAEKETHRLHRMLMNKESDWQVIREKQILFSMVGVHEKDIWEDRQQDRMTGNNELIKSVKAEEDAESVKSSPTCATKYMSGGRGRSRQNLTEAEKEARRLHRILANRESARQTIRRRKDRSVPERALGSLRCSTAMATPILESSQSLSSVALLPFPFPAKLCKTLVLGLVKN
ncbi:hypothetical protein REPUB_Repub04eG0126200 [Reevesia pubescens]